MPVLDDFTAQGDLLDAKALRFRQLVADTADAERRISAAAIAAAQYALQAAQYSSAAVTAAAAIAANPTPGTGTGGTGSTVDQSGQPTLANAVYDTSGNFNATLYRQLAGQAGTEAFIAYRHGPDATFYGTDTASMPTLVKRTDTSLDSVSQRLNPNAPYSRPCNANQCGTWQLGGPVHPNEAGNYSSNHGQVVFIPDNRQAALNSGGIGVADLLMWSCGYNVASTRPELAWWAYGQGMDSLNQKVYKSQGKDTSYPTAIGRGEGRSGWGISTVIAYRSGLITVSGQNTGNNQATCQLAANKVPTAVICTNSHEFALVAVWDTVLLKGQVAMIAMAGTPQGGYLGNENNFEGYRGEWRSVNPGAPSYGNISFMKVVGYVDLPSDMKCPTEIAATTAWYWGAYQQLQDKGDGTDRGYDLRKAADRAVFRSTGQKWGAWPRSCICVVISKEEKKACFIDMGPLFKYYRDSFLNDPGVSNVGQGQGQFPLTFDEYPTQKPTIIKTVNFAFRPTAVRCSIGDLNKRCYIATQEGTLHIFDLGNYPAETGGNPNSIVEVATVPVGRNPTDIAIVKRHSGSEGKEGNYFGVRVYPNAEFDREVIVVCRGDRKIQWVRLNSSFNGGSVIRTVCDSRLIDPITCEDNENHTTEHYEIIVTDYNGKQVIAIRYGVSIFWWYSGVMGDGGGALPFNWDAGIPPNGFPIQSTTHNGIVYMFEHAGAFPFPGKPFRVDSSNVY